MEKSMEEKYTHSMKKSHYEIIYIGSSRIFAFSDTLGSHRCLQVPEDADIIICAGDAVEDNLVGDEYDDFIEWFSALPCKWKIFVSGNHELSFEVDCSLPGSSVHGIFQARVLEWGAFGLSHIYSQDCLNH